jgi:hypothetical protein
VALLSTQHFHVSAIWEDSGLLSKLIGGSNNVEIPKLLPTKQNGMCWEKPQGGGIIPKLRRPRRRRRRRRR